MDTNQQLNYLLNYLIDERQENIEIPENVIQKRNLLRSLMNVRPAIPIDEEFLKVQDEYLTNEIVLILNNYSFSENFKKLYACVFPKGLIEIFCYKEISYFDKFLLDDFKPLNEFGSFNEKCFLSFASFVKDFIKSKHGDFLLICDKIPIDDLNNNIFKISVECEKVTYFTLSGSNDFKNQDIIKVFNFVMVKAIVREIIAHDGFIKKGDKNEKI